MKKNTTTKAATVNTTAAKSATAAKKSAITTTKSISANAKEEKSMKKSTKSETVNTNAITINGVTIPLTEEQSALLAASLMFPATAAPSAPSVKPAKAVTVADSAADDVKPAKATTTTKKSVAKSAAKSVPAQSAAAADEDELTDFGDFEVKIDGNKLSFTAPEGKFLAYKTARYALNNRLKTVCKEHAFNCVYNDKVWAWELKTMLGKPLGKTKMATIKAAVESPVTVAELEDVRDRWSKKSSR